MRRLIGGRTFGPMVAIVSRYIAAGAALVVGVSVASSAQTSSGGVLGPAIPSRPAATTPAPQPTSAPRPTTPRSTARSTARGAAPTVPPRATAQRRVTRTTRKSTTKSKTKVSSSGLGQGARGAAVQAAQERLIELHYDVTEADGVFGAETGYAVMAFQKVNGLPRTGRLTQSVINALDSAVDPDPILPTGGVDRIEVDIEHQYLALYRNGLLNRLVSISSGTGKPFCDKNPDTGAQECDVAITPTGSFKVQSKITGFRESKLGLLYNPVYFNGGFAIHGSASVPATPASHGCVRIPISTSEWFVTEIPEGMPVYLTDGTTTLTPVAGAKQTPSNTGTTAPGTATTTPGTPTTLVTTTTTTSTTTTVPGIVRILTPGSGTPTPTAVGSVTTQPATANTISTATTITATTITPTTVAGTSPTIPITPATVAVVAATTPSSIVKVN